MHSLCDECHGLESENWRHAFVPAEPVGRYCGANGECRDPLKRCGLGCRRAADELTDLRQEMEQSEPEASGEPTCTCQIGTWDKFDNPESCEAHGDAFRDQLRGIRMTPRTGAPKAPCRPTLVVEYTLADGRRYEIALPGDAEIRVAASGALVVTHTERVAALTWIRPMDTE